ncbi:radical SAM protein [Candidatus Woesearchaeota archaeon]|nr:radical SAM protein [Candidatus Woesearchaeota archaeon]
MALGLETELKEPPVLKGFFPNNAKELLESRLTGNLLTANVYFYPECNNQCIMCCDGDSRKKGFTHNGRRIKPLTLGDYTLLIKEFASMGVKTLFVPGAGEPFYVDETDEKTYYVDETSGKKVSKFLKFIEIANGEGLHVIVISSLNPEPSDELVAELKGLNVSIIGKLESMIPERFNAIVNPNKPYNFSRIKGYGHVTRGLKKLMEAGFNEPDKNGQVRLGSGTVIHNFNKDEAENIFRFYRDFDIWPYMQIIAPRERAAKRSDLWGGIDKFEIFSKLLEIDEKEYGYTWDLHYRRVAFDFVYPTIIVYYSGDVLFNAFFRYYLGSVYDDNDHYTDGEITRIANSNPAKWLRKIHFSIGGEKECSPYDHSKCGKILLEPFFDPGEITKRIPEDFFKNNPNDYCPFFSSCTQDKYTGVK